MTNETARILQAQAAWAVARIVHDTLFRITVIFKCRLYSFKKKIKKLLNFLRLLRYSSCKALEVQLTYYAIYKPQGRGTKKFKEEF